MAVVYGSVKPQGKTFVYACPACLRVVVRWSRGGDGGLGGGGEEVEVETPLRGHTMI